MVNIYRQTLSSESMANVPFEPLVCKTFPIPFQMPYTRVSSPCTRVIVPLRGHSPQSHPAFHS